MANYNVYTTPVSELVRPTNSMYRESKLFTIEAQHYFSKRVQQFAACLQERSERDKFLRAQLAHVHGVRVECITFTEDGNYRVHDTGSKAKYQMPDYLRNFLHNRPLVPDEIIMHIDSAPLIG